MQGPLGHARGHGAMNLRQVFSHRLVEGAGKMRHAGGDIEEMCGWSQLVYEGHVVAAGALEPGDVPGVLDLPVTRGQGKTSDQRRAAFAGRAGKRLSGLGYDSEAGDPVSMLAAAGEGPAPADPPASSCRLGRSAGRGGAGHDCVRAIAVDLPVDFRLQHGGKDAAAAGDAHGPPNGAVPSSERSDNLERFRNLDLKAAIAARHEQANHANRPDRFPQVGWQTR